MFQPVGGMDRIPYAFAKELGHVVHYESPVTEVRKTAKGVRVGYTQHGESKPKMIEADYCFCAMPLTQVRKIPNDISAPYKKVIDECTYAGSYKLAWESRRFWEQDYNIYGGLEFVNDGCSPVWLPSWALFSQRGVLVSGYEEAWGAFERMTLQEKYEASRRSVERLHPGHGKELEKPLYVGWRQIPFNEGSWIESYGPGQDQPNARGPMGRLRGGSATNPGYETLLQADGPIYFVGDHVSHIVGWQEGAAVSSLRAIGLLNERVKAARA
jgi:monoamine oxidase